jgi:hypothetical protein
MNAGWGAQDACTNGGTNGRRCRADVAQELCRMSRKSCVAWRADGGSHGGEMVGDMKKNVP